MDQRYREAIGLLKNLIRTPSFSRQEAETADLLSTYLSRRGLKVQRTGNNLWAYNRDFDPNKETILLNSHHDTVRPSAGYTRDPYAADEEGDQLFGLGSNDAGASVVCLIETFLQLEGVPGKRYNLCLALSAEEEITGRDGIERMIPELGPLAFGIIGEPTGMQLAVAERGLMVLDCVARGTAGHAARGEGDNAIYRAMQDIAWLQGYTFPEVSELFGPVKMTVTIIQAGTQHNVVPAECHFTVDVRVTDKYTNEEVFETIRTHLISEVTPRSFRLKPSSIPLNHPLVQAGISLGLKPFGSPTTSDQSLLSIPTLKMGVGESARSHSADEYVCLSEIRQGLDLYEKLLTKVIL